MSHINRLNQQNDAYLQGIESLSEIISLSAEEIQATKQFIKMRIELNFAEQIKDTDPAGYYETKAREMWVRTIEDCKKTGDSQAHIIAKAYEEIGESEKAKIIWGKLADAIVRINENGAEAIAGFVAKYLEKSGRLLEANRYYALVARNKEDDEQKAIALEKIGQDSIQAWEKAGSSYEKGGYEWHSISYLGLAIKCYEKSNNIEKIIEIAKVIVAYFEQNEENLSDKKSFEEQYYETIAKAYERTKDIEKIQMLLELGATRTEEKRDYKYAAELNEKIGNLEKAFEMWKKELDYQLTSDKMLKAHNGPHFYGGAIAYKKLAEIKRILDERLKRSLATCTISSSLFSNVRSF